MTCQREAPMAVMASTWDASISSMASYSSLAQNPIERIAMADNTREHARPDDSDQQ